MISALRPLEELAHARVLVTGASGSIGSAVVEALRGVAIATIPTDIAGVPGHWKLDVCDADQVAATIAEARPTHVFHLAGEKHAPEGELDPVKTTRTNIEGTVNVLRHAGGARVVTASTCKACDPETVYGATKLIAERMTLNAGGSVARFYNVVESSGNVFRLWESLPADEPIPVAPCERYFVSIDDAVALVLWAAILEPGRYAVNPGPPQRMVEIAAALYPGRPHRAIDPRRGDRVKEPRCGHNETTSPTRVAGVVQITSPHE